MHSQRPQSYAILTACALLTAVVFAGCAVRTFTYTEPGADLNRRFTYNWGPVDRQGTGDPRLDNNEIFQARVRSAVDKELAARGFTPAAVENPDVIVHFHASIEQRIVLSGPDESCPDCPPSVYDAGTLMVDLVNPVGNTLLWRGWSEQAVDHVIDNQALMEARIDQAIARIFDRLPRRGN